jgi:hypothetical protein
MKIDHRSEAGKINELMGFFPYFFTATLFSLKFSHHDSDMELVDC